MPRDLRFDINKYPDVVYYYPFNSVKNSQIEQNAKPLGRFYTNDIEPFAWRPIIINGNLTSNYEYVGKIETIDNCSDLRPQMYVRYANGDQIFIVSEIVENEITDKRISARPCVKRQITLRGVKR